MNPETPFKDRRPVRRPVVDERHVEPTLADWAHLVVEASTTDGEQTGPIFLGPQFAASKARFMALEECSPPVAAIVNCTKEVPNHHESEGIDYCRVAVNDEHGANILIYLDGVADFIHRHVTNGSAVLVHCQMGVSRSATVVIAYLMRYRSMTRDDAYRHVKERRPMVNPNPGFWDQLRVYERHLRNTNAERGDTVNVAFDKDWAEKSLTTFHIIGHNVAGSCELFPEISTDSDMPSILCISVDHIFGRGLLSADLQWFSALCDACKKLGGDPERLVDDMFADGSTFMEMWSGEVYPNQILKVKAAVVQS